MKKILFLLAILPMLFTACSSDDNTNMLVGNKYVYKNIHNKYKVIEFTGNETFILYSADLDMTAISESESGSYSLSGDEINFNGFIYRADLFHENKLKKGIVTTNYISINYEYRNFESDNSEIWRESVDNIIFGKK